MKHILLFGLLFSLVLFGGCDSENFDLDGERNVGVVTVISDVNPALFIDGSLESSSVKFVVSDETKVAFDKAYVVISLNDGMQRLKIKEISSLPATVTITAEEAITQVGKTISDITTEDYFVLEVVTESKGKVTRSNAAITVRVVCPFDAELAKGDFSSSSAADDWGSGDITIEADPENPYKVYVHGLPELEGADGDSPLEMTIDPLSFVVKAGKSKVATEAFGYDNLSFAGSGVFNSCTGTFDLLLTVTVDQGSFGSMKFVFTKK